MCVRKVGYCTKLLPLLFVMYHEVNFKSLCTLMAGVNQSLTEFPDCEAFNVYGKVPVVVALIHDLGIQNSNTGIEFLSLQFGAFSNM